jgi:hypothetical protein
MAVKDTLGILTKESTVSSSLINGFENQIKTLQTRLEKESTANKERQDRIACLKILEEVSGHRYDDLDSELCSVNEINLNYSGFEESFKGFTDLVNYFKVTSAISFPKECKQGMFLIGTYSSGNDGEEIPAPGYFTIDEFTEFFPDRLSIDEVLHFLTDQTIHKINPNRFSDRLFQAVVTYDGGEHLVAIDGWENPSRPVIKVLKIWKDTKIQPSYFFRKPRYR